jgi:hypothetical protein
MSGCAAGGSEHQSVKHVLWIGGPPASGKTTIATRLARRYGVRLYSADTRTWEHRDRALLAENPAALRWESMSPVERWERATLPEMFEMSLYNERGPMVIDDLRAFPEAPLIIAEGVTLPPSAVSTGVAQRSQAVWLLPTAEFQDAQLAAAATTPGHVRLYRYLREVIERQARVHDIPTLVVDGSRDAYEMVEAVDQLLGDALAAGPRAVTLQERRRLLREMNEAVIAQIRGYHARPWAQGDPDPVMRSFVCECGGPQCDMDVSLSVQDVAALPAIAPEHRLSSQAGA